MKRRRVVIESPFAGDVEENLRYLRVCMRDCLNRGEAPFASHGLYTGILNDDDPDERKIGLESGWSWMLLADAVIVYEDLGISSGMEEGIVRAKAIGKIVEYRRIR